MSGGRRGSWLSIAVVATILLVIWTVVQQEEETIADSPERGAEQGVESNRRSGKISSDEANTKGGTETVESLRLDYLVRQKSKMETTNPFSSSSWYRPPPPPVLPPTLPPEPVVPPEPTAPPLPFKYLGSYEDGPKRLILLLKDEQMYTVTEGDTIDNTYRVERIEGSRVDMLYLPMGIIQTIDTGESAFSAGKKRGQ